MQYLRHFLRSLNRLNAQLHPRCFIFLAAALQAIYLVVVPPAQSPDEINHFYRAYQISTGQWMPLKQDQRLGGEIPAVFDGFFTRFNQTSGDAVWRISFADVVAAAKIRYNEQEVRFRDFPNTALYSPVSYLPQSLVMAVLRQADLPMGLLYYGTKIFMVILWLMCMSVVLRWLPLCQSSLTYFLLLPMQLYVANSFSADNVTNCLSFLLIAYVFRLLHDQHLQIHSRHILTFIVLGILLALAKVVYIPLLLLLFLLPSSRFRSGKHRLAILALMLIPPFICAVAWSNVIDKYHIPYHQYNELYRDRSALFPEANAPLQKQALAKNPLQLPAIVYNSVMVNGPLYLRGMVAFFGAYMDSIIAEPLYYLAYAVLLALILSEVPALRINRRQRVLIFLIIVIVLSFVILSLHLTWNAVGRVYINCLQGRYLVPLIPLLLAIISGAASFRLPAALLSVTGALVLNAASFYQLYDRYFSKHPLYTSTEFSTDFEKIDSTFIYTSHAQIRLGSSASAVDSSESLSGKYSLSLPAGSQQNCSYIFPSLKKHDRIMVRVFTKGDGTELALTGKDEADPEFFIYFGGITYQDKAGWGFIDFVMTMPDDHDMPEMMVSFGNKGSEATYIDDLEVRIWRRTYK